MEPISATGALLEKHSAGQTHDTESRILASAREQFIRFGYKKTSLDDIVRQVRISKGTIYNYFKNKEALFKCVAEVELQAIYDQLTEEIAAEPNPLNQLKCYASTKIAYLRKYFQNNISVFKELKEAHGHIGTDRSQELWILQNILENGQRQQQFSLRSPQKVAKLMVLLLERFDVRWTQMPFEDAKTEIDAMFDLLFEGIQAKQ